MGIISLTKVVFLLCIFGTYGEIEEKLIDYYENLILRNIEKGRHYHPLTSSLGYRANNEGSPIGKL